MDVVQFSSSPKGHRGQRGFTLIEIMVVVVILGILAAMVVPKVLDRPDQARATAARQDISGLMQALKLYRLDQGRYPSQAQGLKVLAEPNEIFAVVFLDNQHQVLAFEPLFKGTVDQTSVYPRVVVQRALALNASALILAHQHPSGNTEPSAADRAITERLKSALATVDVRVLDHFIVGKGSPYSFAEAGLL
ncbi:TPA: type II secretion system major pseudopilin GspG [Pseudomonas aeruginosa]|nr:type II secretion system major pseudopilin GspG [Pseudomonas aeruginosa]